MKAIFTRSAKALNQDIVAKNISCYELVIACIERIEVVNPKINAIVQFNPEKALDIAKLRDSEISKGVIHGPLHGIPFTLKDVYNTKGDMVTAGCLGLKKNRALEDATIVKRLKQAGAILLGKTNTPELECAADTDNLVYGRTSNPYDLNFSSGGSSGGSAAIVSAAGSVFDVGADTGGSLRIPAHYCGIAGVRPTIGRIPSSGVVYGLRTGIASAFTSEGPLSRYVEDLPMLLSLLQGEDDNDPNTFAKQAIKPMNEVDLSHLNIAFQDSNSIIETSEETKIAIEAVCKLLMDRGARVIESAPPDLEQGHLLFQQMLGANGTHDFQSALHKMNQPQASSLLKKIMKHLAKFSCDLPTFMQRWEQWQYYRSRVLHFFKDFDVLLYPVSPDSALNHSSPMWDPLRIDFASYTWTISATLLPVVVVRIGTSKTKLPIGIQIISKPFQEHIAFAVAHYLESLLGGWQMPDLSA